MKKGWILAVGMMVGLVGGVKPAFGQQLCTANCTVTVGQGFTVMFDHNPNAPGAAPTSGYRLYLDNVRVGSDIPLTALQNGTVTLTAVTATTRGAHQLRVAAFNADRETSSGNLALTAELGAPPAPTNLRIQISITVAEDGTVQFKVVGVEKANGGGE